MYFAKPFFLKNPFVEVAISSVIWRLKFETIRQLINNLLHLALSKMILAESSSQHFMPTEVKLLVSRYIFFVSCCRQCKFCSHFPTVTV
jgi:biotin synthase-like enzyme